MRQCNGCCATCEFFIDHRDFWDIIWDTREESPHCERNDESEKYFEAQCLKLWDLLIDKKMI